MQKILYFDECAIVIFIIILIATYMRKATKGTVNRIFITMTVLALITTCADFFSEIINNDPISRAERLPLLYTLYYIYFLARNTATWGFTFFLYAITRTTYKLRKPHIQILIMAPYAVLVALVLSNPLHHKIFYVTPQEGYIRGPWFLALYAIAVYYVFYGENYLLYCRHFVSFAKWLAMQSMYAMSLLAVFFQLFHPEYLVEMFSMSMSILMVMLLVLRPEEIMDASVELPSWRAYKEELYKITLLHRPVLIVVVRFMNAWKVRSYLGEESYHAYIRQITGQVEKFMNNEHLRGEIYYEIPGSLYIIMDKKYAGFDVEHALPTVKKMVEEQTKEIMESGIELDAKVCAIHYPENVETDSDIIRLGHDFYGLIPPEQRFVNASEIVGTERYTLGNQMDSILNRAIREQGFEMYYQPIYSVKEQKFVSAEALVRLWDREFGMISPGYFIPAAENKGLIVAIGDVILDAVYRFISEHDLASLGLSYMEINLSVAQCMQKDLPQKLRTLQDKYGVRPAQVNLEILETTYDDIGNIAEKNIQELVEMGYSFSLDDYGTGYSNIQRVSTLPLKIIKVDKSLVDGMSTQKGTSILRNTVRMMKEIKKELVVEGVETEEAVRELSAMDCDFIQGYYYSKPLPAKEFVAFLEQQRQAG